MVAVTRANVAKAAAAAPPPVLRTSAIATVRFTKRGRALARKHVFDDPHSLHFYYFTSHPQTHEVKHHYFSAHHHRCISLPYPVEHVLFR